jgi:glutathione-regulated potassium-efflux system ancillary protein KefC
MTETWMLAGLWLALALLAALFSVWFRVATALSEILVGVAAQLVIGYFFGSSAIGADQPWIKFLSSTGAIMLTFLAGAEIDPDVFKLRWKEATGIGIASFLSPFLGCTVIAYYFLHWAAEASWLAGVALSTTSVAVVYAVMLEFRLNTTVFGKTVLAACFITDLGTVLALGLIFSPFTTRTVIFVVVSLIVCIGLPFFTPRFFRHYGGRPSEIEAKFLLGTLFGMAALAGWAGSEAVLPAYVIGMVLAKCVGRDHQLIRRLRTLSLGLLTPFYFIRAGSYISVPALVSAPATFLVLLIGKLVTKFIAVHPATRYFGSPATEGMYTTLLMSTGLTFGSISALFGLTHNIIDASQYSLLVAAVIASAVVPTMIANAYYLPKHLMEPAEARVRPTAPSTSHGIGENQGENS